MSKQLTEALQGGVELFKFIWSPQRAAGIEKDTIISHLLCIISISH